MTDVLAIHMRANGDGHRDLSIKLASFPNLILDSYYFSLAVESSDNISSVSDALAALLTYWLAAIGKAVLGQAIYLPIDFSDQYTSCFKVDNLGDSLSMDFLNKKDGM